MYNMYTVPHCLKEQYTVCVVVVHLNKQEVRVRPEQYTVHQYVKCRYLREKTRGAKYLNKYSRNKEVINKKKLQLNNGIGGGYVQNIINI